MDLLPLGSIEQISRHGRNDHFEKENYYGQNRKQFSQRDQQEHHRNLPQSNQRNEFSAWEDKSRIDNFQQNGSRDFNYG